MALYNYFIESGLVYQYQLYELTKEFCVFERRKT